MTMNVTPPTKKYRVRWWPALAIIIFASLTTLLIWLSDSTNRQAQIEQTGGALFVTFLLLLIWLFAFSRLPRRFCLLALGALGLLLGLGWSLFRVRGVSGDVLPILEWRFAQIKVAPLPQGASALVDTALASTAMQSAREESQPRTVTEIPRQPVIAKPVTSLRRDYPQFLGPNRDAKMPGIKLNRDWTKHPPQRLWRQNIGAGWSSFAVAGDFAITQEQRGAIEMVVAYDLTSGRVRWSHGDSTGFISPITGDGPRATPTIAQNRVYTQGATGWLNCLELKSGKRLWAKNILQDNNAQIKEWGMAGSPLVVDSLVVVSAGGQNNQSLAAYHQDDGRKIWSAGQDRAGYSSPLLTALLGTRQILIFNLGNVVAHEAVTGKILWEFSWPGGGTQHVAQPVVLPEHRVLVSSGYGVGCKLIQIQPADSTGFRATLVWETNQLKAKFNNVVQRDGYIYGLDDGILVCLDLATGTRKWKAGRYGHGQLVNVDDLLLVQAESGDVVLVEATPAAHEELARFAALAGKTWNNPALAGEYLLVRNDREAACYQLALEPAAK